MNQVVAEKSQMIVRDHFDEIRSLGDNLSGSIENYANHIICNKPVRDTLIKALTQLTQKAVNIELSAIIDYNVSRNLVG